MHQSTQDYSARTIRQRTSPPRYHADYECELPPEARAEFFEKRPTIPSSPRVEQKPDRPALLIWAGVIAFVAVILAGTITGNRKPAALPQAPAMLPQSASAPLPAPAPQKSAREPLGPLATSQAAIQPSPAPAGSPPLSLGLSTPLPSVLPASPVAPAPAAPAVEVRRAEPVPVTVRRAALMRLPAPEIGVYKWFVLPEKVGGGIVWGRFMGTKQLFSQIPPHPTPGDMWDVTETGTSWIYCVPLGGNSYQWLDP